MQAQTILFILLFVIITIPVAALGGGLAGLIVHVKQAGRPWLNGLLVFVINVAVTVPTFSLWNSYFYALKSLRPRPEAVELLMHTGAALVLFGAGPSVVATLIMLALARHRLRLVGRKLGSRAP